MRWFATPRRCSGGRKMCAEDQILGGLARRCRRPEVEQHPEQRGTGSPISMMANTRFHDLFPDIVRSGREFVVESYGIRDCSSPEIAVLGFSGVFWPGSSRKTTTHWPGGLRFPVIRREFPNVPGSAMGISGEIRFSEANPAYVNGFEPRQHPTQAEGSPGTA